MARYIDADKFIERLNASPAFPNMSTDGYFLLGVVEDLLKMQPAADVAPKSEVAREIFEEIKREFNGAYYYKGYTIERYIAELEKKYTEERE